MGNRIYNLEKYIHGKNHHKRKSQPKSAVRKFRLSQGNDTGYNRADLHNLALHSAKNRIKEELRDAKADKAPGVKFIHGFHGGTVIRDWLRSESLLQFMSSANISGKVWANDEGTTCVSLSYY
jgi:hypothetical protein